MRYRLRVTKAVIPTWDGVSIDWAWRLRDRARPMASWNTGSRDTPCKTPYLQHCHCSGNTRWWKCACAFPRTCLQPQAVIAPLHGRHSGETCRRQSERHAKGDADLYVKRTVNHNIAFVRELLLEGLLVDRGLLDRRKLEQALSDDPSRLSVTIGEIIHHLATEAWLRSWTARTERNLPRKSALPASTVMEQIG